MALFIPLKSASRSWRLVHVKFGIDIGYSSVKMVLLDENGGGRVFGLSVAQGKRRGRGETISRGNRGKAPAQPHRIRRHDRKRRSILTGSQGALASMKWPPWLKLPRRSAPRSGRSSKSEAKARIHFGIEGKQSVPAKNIHELNCSAGTGSFFEEQVSRLGLHLEDYSKYASRAKSIPRIAAGAGVFAKRISRTTSRRGCGGGHSLGAGLCRGADFRVSVMKKVPLEKPVLLAGGVARNTSVSTALKSVLGLNENELIRPEFWRPSERTGRGPDRQEGTFAP